QCGQDRAASLFHNTKKSFKFFPTVTCCYEPLFPIPYSLFPVPFWGKG
ncbi:MAG: hypothetical protein F6K56_13410, partial [Moorea sp. SIO3G5]|nr:hypothetical protein [Moorena sp. SIO3G5]